jgi:hypothetical protein
MTVELPVLLMVRGTLVPSSLDAARSLHNDTAGSPAGIAAARALGDLSHQVFAPVVHPQSNAKSGELLFLDFWQDARGIGEFFSHEEVVGQGAKMFRAKEPSIWMPARGSYSYELPPVRGQDKRFVAMIRGPIASAERAIELFSASSAKGARDGRRRGLLSHRTFIKVNMPGDPSPLELLGLAVWSNLAGMGEHYSDKTLMDGVGDAFVSTSTSIWEQAPGNWSEW